MPYELFIQKSTGRLNKYESEIQNHIATTYHLAEKKLPQLLVTIIVLDAPDSTIPELGTGGFTPNKNAIYIFTNPGKPNFSQILSEGMPVTLAHEMHHSARWQTVGYGETLLEALVSEGLADHFALEIIPASPPPWSSALNTEEQGNLAERARQHFDDQNYNHPAWFFGSKEDNLPRWTGYRLGYKLVGDYLKKNGKTASELVTESAKAFIRD